MAEQKPIAEQSFLELLAGLKSSVEELHATLGHPIELQPLPAALPKQEVERG